ncbi:MAG: hypothetical protein AAF563_01715 [Pseudomonadota bacterium]
MPGGDITSVFLLGLLAFWIGVLVCLRRYLAVKPMPQPTWPGMPTTRARKARQGDDDLDGMTLLGVSLVIVGYMIMAYVLTFWEVGLGAVAFFAGFVLIPVVAAWRTR